MTEREYNRIREIIPPKQEPNTKEEKNTHQNKAEQPREEK